MFHKSITGRCLVTNKEDTVKKLVIEVNMGINLESSSIS